MRFASRLAVVVSLIAFSISASALGAGDTKDVGQSPQAKAFAAMTKAVQTGDYEAYKKCHTKERAEKIDQDVKEILKMDSKKLMDFTKEMAPKGLKYTSLKVDGKKATLEATGKVGGQPNKGTILLEDEGGQWKIASEWWSNAK